MSVGAVVAWIERAVLCLIVLQSKDMVPEAMVYEASAELILGVAVVALHHADRMNPEQPVSELNDEMFEERQRSPPVPQMPLAAAFVSAS